MNARKEEEKIITIFPIAIILIIAFGGIVGVLAGISVMGPTADIIEKAIKYPSLYEDMLLEKHWTMASTIYAGIIWAFTAVVALYFYGKKLSLQMLNRLVELNGGYHQETIEVQEEDNMETAVE